MVDLSNDDVGRLQMLLASSTLSSANRSLLHRTLAVWFDRRRDYDAAFDHFRQANELKKQELQRTGRAFNAARFHELVDRHIATLDESFFQQPRLAASTSELPIFIVGMPRSGTTLVEQILSSHSQVVGAGELHTLAQLVRALDRTSAPMGYPACLRSVDGAYLQEMANRYLAHLVEIGGLAARVIDKMPGNFVHLGLIALLFPQARVIHCRRDPLDVCLSCYFQNFARINFSVSFEDLASYYGEYERLMAHWRRIQPVRMIEVQYEELVAHQNDVSRALVGFCGLEWDERCLEFYQNTRPVQTSSVLQVRRPMYSTSIGRWKHYEAYLGPLRAALERATPPRD